jgi:hypothetical protein
MFVSVIGISPVQALITVPQMSFKNITNSDWFIEIHRHAFDFTILGSVESLISTSSSVLILKKDIFNREIFSTFFEHPENLIPVLAELKHRNLESLHCEPPTVMKVICKALCLLS